MLQRGGLLGAEATLPTSKTNQPREPACFASGANHLIGTLKGHRHLILQPNSGAGKQRLLGYAFACVLIAAARWYGTKYTFTEEKAVSPLLDCDDLHSSRSVDFTHPNTNVAANTRDDLLVVKREGQRGFIANPQPRISCHQRLDSCADPGSLFALREESVA